MKHLKDCSREDLIRIIATIKDGIDFSNHNTGLDDETCDMLNRIGSQAIKECDKIGWKIEEKPKLEWQQNPPKERMTWYEALQYAKSLEDGWKLPTIKELTQAQINKVEEFYPFPYWSIDTYEQDPSIVWFLHFLYGNVDVSSKASNYYVRCVRKVK